MESPASLSRVSHGSEESVLSTSLGWIFRPHTPLPKKPPLRPPFLFRHLLIFSCAFFVKPQHHLTRNSFLDLTDPTSQPPPNQPPLKKLIEYRKWGSPYVTVIFQWRIGLWKMSFSNTSSMTTWSPIILFISDITRASLFRSARTS